VDAGLAAATIFNTCVFSVLLQILCAGMSMQAAFVKDWAITQKHAFHKRSCNLYTLTSRSHHLQTLTGQPSTLAFFGSADVKKKKANQKNKQD